MSLTLYDEWLSILTERVPEALALCPQMIMMGNKNLIASKVEINYGFSLTGRIQASLTQF